MASLRWRWRVLAAVAALGAASPPAWAKCTVGRLAELPVTMSGPRPLVTAKFGTREARFMLDSGAFYSLISRASAAEFALKTEPAPPWFQVSGIGGSTAVEFGRADTFSLAGIPIPKAEFIVGGSDTGAVGVIGQNILGIADVEYDLRHGAVRLMKTSGCGKTSLAYWAGERPFSAVDLVPGERDGVFKPHTIGFVEVNGVKLRALFDTGAATSLLSASAAKRAGVAVDRSREPDGVSAGIGSRPIRTWIAGFDRIDVGGEVVSHPQLPVADTDLELADMLIGADFFLSHRVFVSNAARRLYFTYEGGPVFGVNPRGARTAAGVRLDLTDTTAAPTDADGFSRRGAAYAAAGKPALALADFDKALGLAPNTARYLLQRADAHFALKQEALARADLDAAIAAAPDDAPSRLLRAHLRAAAKDRTGALADLAAADKALAAGANARIELASLYSALDDEAAALANYDAWLKLHAQDVSRVPALNGRCWARALLNRELDKALDDCNAALKLAPRSAAILDSRALVYLRKGALDRARADYDAALALAPGSAWSLYMRGVTEARAGKAEAAARDRAAALAIDPDAGARAKRYGLEG